MPATLEPVHASLLAVRPYGPLCFVAPERFTARLRDFADRHADVPHDAAQLVAELLAPEDGVPGRYAAAKGTYADSLQLYTGRWWLRVGASGRGDALVLRDIRPVAARDRFALAQGAILLRPGRYHVVADVRETPPGCDACWPQIVRAWQSLPAPAARPPEGRPALGRAQRDFLDTMDRLVDVMAKAEQKAAQGEFVYKDIHAVGSVRHTDAARYFFTLHGAQRPPEDAYVRIDQPYPLQGQVVRIGGDGVEIRFDEPVARSELPGQGVLRIAPADVVHSVRREAVRMLRDGESAHPTLLPALAEHRYAGLRGQRGQQPAEPLDAEQLAAFRAALANQDLVAVLGPPGTGKTRTITEAAGALARRGQRVLVTSHANRAVDNVLSRLPEDLVVIRVGNEGKITEDGMPYLLDRQVEAIAGEIAARTRSRADAYACLDQAEAWHRRLHQDLARLAEARAETGERTAAWQDAARRSAPEQAAARERHAGLAARLGTRIEGTGRALHALEAKLAGATQGTGAAFWLLHPVTAWRRRRRTAVRTRLDALHAEHRQALAALRTAEAQLRAAVAADPAVRAAEQALAKARQRLADDGQAVRKSAAATTDALTPLGDPAGAPAAKALADTDDPAALHARATAFAGAVGDRIRTEQARRQLTAQWGEEIADDPRRLVPELVRHAHVIGATCIGAGTRKELVGLDIDTAIVDEAGQISLPDVLVPLVRARRGLLVGDPRQLPPFLASTAHEHGGAGSEIGGLLARSALELVERHIPPQQRVQLVRQRRMPAEIASFLSDAFYDGLLRTETPKRPPLAPFTSPLVFVDTSDRPEHERGERRAARDGAAQGVFNDLEARLLADLADWAQQAGAEWRAITPYRAQLQRTVPLVARRIGNSQLAAEAVGTVDSYQGGESPVVLYGFTRSNPHGRVGFLREVRRINVALSRAQRQLVMVGDLGTLLAARDDGVRELIGHLAEHLRTQGQIVPSRDLPVILHQHGVIQ